jgi:hypothetical protein
MFGLLLVIGGWNAGVRSVREKYLILDMSIADVDGCDSDRVVPARRSVASS